MPAASTNPRHYYRLVAVAKKEKEKMSLDSSVEVVDTVVKVTTLNLPLLLEAIAASAATAGFAGLFFVSNHAQQKASLLSTVGSFALALFTWLLFVGEMSSLRWIGYVFFFGAIVASAACTLLVHSWAKLSLLFFSSLVPLLALLSTQMVTKDAQTVIGIFALPIIIVMMMLLVSNSFRRDRIGLVLIIAAPCAILFYALIFALGPEMYAVKGFTAAIYSWLLFAADMVAIAVAAFAWYFAEEEQSYAARKGITLHQHMATGDGMDVALIPRYSA
jgi:hypothetical protein